MNPITVHVHSMVDLITNSSTEIYIRANKETVRTTKKIINAILSAANSKKTCDDLFNIKVRTTTNEWDEEVTDMVIEPLPGVTIDADIVSLMRNAFDISAEFDG